MKLYYHPISAYSRKVLLALYEKGIEFEREIVDLFDPVAKARYREKNVTGKVPFLELEDWAIPESSIIIEYLDTHFDSGPRLIPEEKNLARRARFHDRVGDLYLIDPVVGIMFEGMKPEAEQSAQKIEALTGRLRMGLPFMDRTLKEQPFLLGDEITLADLAPSSGLELARSMKLPIDEYEHVAAWLERMTARESWKKILEEVEAFQKG